MNKAELVQALTERLDGDRRVAAAALDGLLDVIVRTVQAGEAVSITGFGVFERRERAARSARNPRTGELIDIPATSVPAFRPGAMFRDVVSGTRHAPEPRAAATRAPRPTNAAVSAATSAPAASNGQRVAASVSPAAEAAPAPKVTAPKAAKAVPAKAATAKAATAKAVPAKAATAKAVSAKAVSAKAVPAKIGKADKTAGKAPDKAAKPAAEAKAPDKKAKATTEAKGGKKKAKK
ncbi:MAG TPA: HU family DNA-binding protein [Pseudonocardia sp.]